MPATEYKLQFEDRIFYTLFGKPPRLIRLGSHEVLEWHDTVPNPNNRRGKIAKYKIAMIADFGYIHLETGQQG